MAKKKILLLSDDLRMSSGIANVSKQFVLGTVDKYDWVQLGAAINHPDQGKIFDLSDEVRKTTGVQDANVKLIPFNGYGNPDIIRQLLMVERPDAILHFTDPRYWIWLYEIEHEIRQSVPLFFYHIWDDLPDPKYNRDYYESCDWIGCISKQTYGITKRVWGMDDEKTWTPAKDWQVSYVPHGINSQIYKPLDNVNDEFKKSIFGDKEYDFVLYWNNRNIRRKQPIDTILAFDKFVRDLPKEKRDKVCLLMHTTPVEEHGTDLPTTIEHCCSKETNIIFTQARYTEEQLNILYNIADVTINIASNEGFGLATAESVMAGTPIIVNVTGGMQDQCGFEMNGKYLTADDYVKIGSLNDKKKYEGTKHGEWAKVIWPTRSTAGSIPTPYIFDDKVDFADVAPLIHEWYKMTREERKSAGLKGREWMLSDGNLSLKYMCDSLSEGMDTALQNWKPRKKHQLFELV